jgi:hypothetical protein
MKIIRCTKKLIKELGVDPEENICAESWLESWHANSFTIDGEKCVIITNDATLYTLFLCGLRREDFQNFSFIVNEYFFKSLMTDGLSQPLIEKALAVGDDVVFTGSTDKAVMGSTHYFRQRIERICETNGGFENCCSLEIQKAINRTPIKAINYQYPVEKFFERLNNE